MRSSSYLRYSYSRSSYLRSSSYLRLASYLSYSRLSGNLKRPLVPLQVVKSSLELGLGNIPGKAGWDGSNSDYKANSAQLQLQLHTGTELGKKDLVYTGQLLVYSLSERHSNSISCLLCFLELHPYKESHPVCF